MTTLNELTSVNHRILAWTKRHRAVLLAVAFMLCGRRTSPPAFLLRAVTIFALCSQAGAWSQAKLSAGQESATEITLHGHVTAQGRPVD
jgi:hypothetical protein